jgi:hypothetical protein
MTHPKARRDMLQHNMPQMRCMSADILASRGIERALAGGPRRVPLPPPPPPQIRQKVQDITRAARAESSAARGATCYGSGGMARAVGPHTRGGGEAVQL